MNALTLEDYLTQLEKFKSLTHLGRYYNLITKRNLNNLDPDNQQWINQFLDRWEKTTKLFGSKSYNSNFIDKFTSVKLTRSNLTNIDILNREHRELLDFLETLAECRIATSRLCIARKCLDQLKLIEETKLPISILVKNFRTRQEPLVSMCSKETYQQEIDAYLLRLDKLTLKLQAQFDVLNNG